MLLNDSVETEEFSDYSVSAKHLKMKRDIDMSKIWIPADLLPNRKIPRNPNENKPFIYYTLERPGDQERFSVYVDECPIYHESQTSSTIPSGISHHKLMNSNIDGIFTQQTRLLSQSSVEQDGILDIGTSEDETSSLINETSSNHPVNSIKPDVALRNSPERYNFMDRNADQWEKKASKQNACDNESLENLTRRMAEILSEDEPLKENWHYEDTIKTDETITGSSIPPSAEDSLEELYYSDEDDNQFDAEEYELLNQENESPEKTHKCSIYTENSYKQERPTESFVGNLNDLEQSNNNSDKTFDETVEILSEEQKFTVGDVTKQIEFDDANKIESAVHVKDPEQELLDTRISNDFTENVLELPVAYKRPPLKEHTNKTKQQKEKKRTKKGKINIPIEDLFKDEEVDRFKVPEVDEFYENLVRQGKCKPRNQVTNEFPSLDTLQNQQAIAHVFPSIDLLEKSLTPKQSASFWDSSQAYVQSLDCEPQADSADKIENEINTGPELDSKNSLETIILDNIPSSVSKESIENLILGYGELKNLIIEQHGRFQRAKIQMDFICDIDWIVECLKDSQPFGSSSTELVKCYRQT